MTKIEEFLLQEASSLDTVPAYLETGKEASSHIGLPVANLAPDTIRPSRFRGLASWFGCSANTGSQPTIAELQHERKITPHPRLKKLLAAVSLTAIAAGAYHAVEPKAALVSEMAASDYFLSNSQKEITLASDETSPDLAYAKLESGFGIGNGLLASTNELTYKRWYPTTWNLAVALNALDMLSLNPSQAQDKIRESFYKTLLAANSNYLGVQYNGRIGFDPGIAEFNNKSSGCFVDDNLWMAIINLTAGNVKLAEQIAGLAHSQWDQKDGGNTWKLQQPGETSHGRNTVSNAPAVILDALLYMKTGNLKYKEWAKQTYKWLVSTLQDPATHLFYDHITDGVIDDTIYTYTQGIAAGAMAAMHLLEPEKYPLQDAVDQIKLSMSHFTKYGSYNSNAAFNFIFFKYALWIAGLKNDKSFTTQVLWNLNAALKRAPYGSDALIDQSAIAGMQGLQSLEPSQYSNLLPTLKN